MTSSILTIKPALAGLLAMAKGQNDRVEVVIFGYDDFGAGVYEIGGDFSDRRSCSDIRESPLGALMSLRVNVFYELHGLYYARKREAEEELLRKLRAEDALRAQRAKDEA